jgi:DNA polymerase
LSPKLLCSPSNSSTRPPAVDLPDQHRIGSAPSRGARRCGVIDGMNQENHPAQPPEGVGLDGLRTAAAGCRACELWEPATQTVFGEGPETARIVFVGEQPGDQEDRKGEPFVGPAGRLLDKALADAGIDRRDAYITNAVKHFRFTPKGKRRMHQTPGPEHLRACRPWLEAEFAVLQPEVVVCLGATAAKALISPSFRITKDRGQLLPWTPPGAEEDEEDAPHQTWMLATTHPSAILRTPDDARDAAYAALVADLAVVAGALA